MKKGTSWFIKKGVLTKTPFIRKLAPGFLEKARNNLVTMSVLSDLHTSDEAKDLLHVPHDYDPSEWVVVCGYYAVYMAASAALARISYRSKNHTATILALETFFVRKQLLEPRYLKMIERVQLKKEHVEQLKLARDRREIAQYKRYKRNDPIHSRAG